MHKVCNFAYQKDQDPEIVSHYYKILIKNGLKEKEDDLKQSLIENPNNNDLLQLLDDITNEAAQL